MDSFRAAIPDSYKDEWQNSQNMQAQIRGADVAQPRAPAWLLGSQLRLGQGKCFLSPFVREELRKDCLGEPRRAFGLELSWHHPCLHYLYLYKQFILLGCNCHQSELASDKIQHRLRLRASSASSKSPPVYIKKKKKMQTSKKWTLLQRAVFWGKTAFQTGGQGSTSPLHTTQNSSKRSGGQLLPKWCSCMLPSCGLQADTKQDPRVN